MQLLITNATNATPPDAGALDRLAGLNLPNLTALAGLLQPQILLKDVPDRLNTLPEHLHAQALGLHLPDGRLPWAALLARDNALPGAAESGWAMVTPCHWKVNADHVEMFAPENLDISAIERHRLFEAMQPYFLEDGITLHALADGQWLAHGSALAGMQSASLERVNAGRVDAWLPREPQYRGLRRLQNEMQMLLYTHPVNDERAARGLPGINSFWISGTGDIPAGWQPPVVPVRLLRLGELPSHTDPKARLDHWLTAWQNADATVLAGLVDAIRQSEATGTHDPLLSLTLCGPQSAQRFVPHKPSLWTGLRNRLRRPSIAQLFTQL